MNECHASQAWINKPKDPAVQKHLSPIAVCGACLWFAIFSLLARVAEGQIAGSANTNIFFDENPHTICLRDGCIMRGQIVSCDEEAIILRRSGVSAPLHILRDQVSRVLLASPDSAALSPNYLSAVRILPRRNSESLKPLVPTVQFNDSDWLRGALQSSDGNTFALTLLPGQTIHIARPQISSMLFQREQAPGFCLSANRPELLAGWTGGTGRATAKFNDAGITIPPGEWISHDLGDLRKCEISFSLPAAEEDGARLCFQPRFGMLGTGSRTNGTVTFDLNAEHLAKTVDFLPSEDIPVPKANPPQEGTVFYRLHLDDVKGRLIIARNGVQVTTCDTTSRRDAKANWIDSANNRLHAVCLGRAMERAEYQRPLTFTEFKVRAWNGDLPQGESHDAPADSLSEADAPSTPGNLELLNSQSLKFAGEEKSITEGMLIQFPNHALPLAMADCHLLLGNHGELNAASLRFDGTQFHCKTCFASELNLSLDTVVSIFFINRRAPLPSSPNLLCFKNGDQISGTLIHAAAGESVLWRLPSGQEVEVSADQVIGIRTYFVPNAPNELPAIALSNGDCLRAAFFALDETQLHLFHSAFGELAIPRKSLLRILFNKDFIAACGEWSPDAWIYPDKPAGAQPDRAPSTSQDIKPWICFDGKFIAQNQPALLGMRGGLHAPVCDSADRFEISFDALHTSGDRPPGFYCTLHPGFRKQVTIQSNSTNLEITIAGAGAGNRRQIPMPESAATARINVHIFVNSKTGTAEIFLNGVSLAKIGASPGEAFPGIRESFALYPNFVDGYATVFANLWVGPWSGEHGPQNPGDAEVLLVNGDALGGAVKETRDGKLLLESELGPVALPVENTQAINFGTAFSPRRTAARLRLRDGSSLNIDAYHFENGEVKGSSDTLGEIRVPESALAELILAPTLPERSPASVLDSPAAK